eukprot:m.362310 g.362310  ORF g.362310 m.362310 type:complete len:438 (-) comp20289_c0_seq1:209-1522(-)
MPPQSASTVDRVDCSWCNVCVAAIIGAVVSILAVIVPMTLVAYQSQMENFNEDDIVSMSAVVARVRYFGTLVQVIVFAMSIPTALVFLKREREDWAERQIILDEKREAEADAQVAEENHALLQATTDLINSLPSFRLITKLLQTPVGETVTLRVSDKPQYMPTMAPTRLYSGMPPRVMFSGSTMPSYAMSGAADVTTTTKAKGDKKDRERVNRGLLVKLIMDRIITGRGFHTSTRRLIRRHFSQVMLQLAEVSQFPIHDYRDFPELRVFRLRLVVFTDYFRIFLKDFAEKHGTTPEHIIALILSHFLTIPDIPDSESESESETEGHTDRSELKSRQSRASVRPHPSAPDATTDRATDSRSHKAKPRARTRSSVLPDETSTTLSEKILAKEIWDFMERMSLSQLLQDIQTRHNKSEPPSLRNSTDSTQQNAKPTSPKT